MSKAEYLKLSDARADARKALTCLYLELPESIGDDVRDKIESAFTAYDNYISTLPTDGETK